MKDTLNLITNRWKQHIKRVFLSDAEDNFIQYESLVTYLLNLNYMLEKKLKSEYPTITIVSENLLLKMVVFMYCFITNTRMILISPKFEIGAIVNAISAKRSNVLLLDNGIKHLIGLYEEEESIDVLKYFKYVKTTAELLEFITGPAPIGFQNKHNINKLYKKGLLVIKSLTEENSLFKRIYKYDLYETTVPQLTILSPGTTAYSSFLNIPYKVLCKSAQLMTYFLGLKPDDKVSVIADFEYFTSAFTLLGFLTGIQYVRVNTNISSAEEFKDELGKHRVKPNVILIDSYRFKLIWDSILLKVYGSKLMLNLSRTKLLERIPEILVLREIEKLFGKGTKVHILNEELGLYCLNILRRSKVLFTSSYGYLEQGNFLAFKDPTLFKHKKFYSKPGGTILKDNPLLFDNVYLSTEREVFVEGADDCLGELIVKSTVAEEPWIMHSEDLAVEIPNVSAQGARKFLYIFGRAKRYLFPYIKTSLELTEKAIKDTLLVKDCMLVQRNDNFIVFIEPREEICDIHRIGWKEVVSAVEKLIVDLNKDKGINILKYAVIGFNGIRNVAGKIQLHYNL